MCDVVTPIIGIATALASTSLSVAQQAEAAQYSRYQDNYAARLASMEQARSTEAAQRSLAEGENEAALQRRQAARKQGELTAELAAQGVTLDSGSSLSLLSEQAEDAAYESKMIRQQAADNALRHQQNAHDAYLRSINAGMGMKNTGYNQAHSLLGGITSITGKASSLLS